MKKRLLLFFLLFSVILSSKAQTFTVDGINYSLSPTNPDEVYVDNNSTYTGDLVIPPTVVYENQEYQVTGIWPWAFNNNGNLTSVSFPESLTIIAEGAFENCMGLSSITLPESLEHIGANAFRNTGLSQITIPENIKLAPFCFSDCYSLSQIIFPSSIRQLPLSAFHGSTNVNTIVCASVVPPVTINDLQDFGYQDDGYLPVFGGWCTIHVPEGTGREYEEDKFWGRYNITEVYMVPEYWLINGTYSPSLARKIADSYNETNDPLKIYVLEKGKFELDIYNFPPIGELRFFNDFTGDWVQLSQFINRSEWINADEISSICTIPKERWCFLSFPYDVNVDDVYLKITERTGWETIVRHDINYNQELPFDFVVRYYDAERRANENATGFSWRDVEPGTTIPAGIPVIVQAGFKDPNSFPQNEIETAWEMVFPASGDFSQTIFQNLNWDSKEVALEEHYSNMEEHRNWNFIANPYPSYYDMYYAQYGYYEPIYGIISIYNPLTSSYNAYSLLDDDVILAPSQPFFIQKDYYYWSGSISFHEEGRQFEPSVVSREPRFRMARAKSNRALFNIRLLQGEKYDDTRLVLNDDAAIDYEINRDASKFFSDNRGMPQIYSVLGNGAELAINERPEGIVPIGFYAPEAGEMTISFPRVDGKAVLYDSVTGEEILLADDKEYRFTADKAGHNTERFSIKMEQTSSSGIETMIPDSDIRIYVENRFLHVEGAKGQNISVTAIDGLDILNGTVSTDNERFEMASGLYCIRVGGKSVKCIIK